jgi:hypothetical protein
MKFHLIGLGIVLIVLWFGLTLAPISTITGAPIDVPYLQSMDDVQRYLQEHNRAIVRTISVLGWFLFFFVWWFLTGLFDFFKAMTAVRVYDSEYPELTNRIVGRGGVQ